MWRLIEDDWTLDRRAQLDASISQHNISRGVRELYLTEKRKKVTDLAQDLEVEYHRLQKMLAGRVVMQMVDLARLRLLIGTRLDYWMMRGESAEYIRAVERDLHRKKQRQAQAQRAGAPYAGVHTVLRHAE
ncbi:MULTISPECIES: hypothetical protein [unclassified Microbacterium]|uniref:hypothetical protein n=1 Tax=unclassified Microbacterium TaxID=2609290 RepID=UPI0021A28ECE|nr:MULTISPECIES: hypothetical protein [unclassified Microbacterium]MCT1364103.1 hypothetical protein [Microbacterium sp. p3-SID131]MCT1375255.1 hypothetical protein [Microbacterium sp. p3-SID337]